MKTSRQSPALENALFKLRIVCLPFLLIAISLLVVYSLLNWLLFIRTGSIAVREDVLHYWVPISLAVVAVLLWIRPRLRFLKLRLERGDLPFLYGFVAVAAISVPVIIAQEYLATATGKLTELESVRKVKRWETTKYYKIRNAFADKHHAAATFKADVSGKRNENLNFNLYLACPLYDKQDVMKLDNLDPFFTAGYKPTVFLDGEVVDSAQVGSISMDSVRSIFMLGLRASRSVYGRDAWNGAIFVEKIPEQLEDLNAPSEIHKFSPRAWVCVRYQKSISNNLSDESKEIEYRSFITGSLQDYKNRDLEGYAYLDRIGNTVERLGYVQAIRESNYYDDSNPLILAPVFTPYKDRNGHKLGWLLGSLGMGAGVWLVMVLAAGVRTRNLRELTRGRRADHRALQDLGTLMVPRSGFFITPIIMYLNIGVFLLMVFAGLGLISFEAVDLLRWGGNFRPYTIVGEWWRLLTSMFVHGGILHLLMNMVGLVFVSVFLEPLLGRARFALLYLLTGLAGSLASVLWYPAIVSIGASGAIFGLYGVFLALLLARVFPPELSKAFLVSTLVFVGYNLLMGLSGGIDNAAHIGGLVSGLLAGFCVYPFLRQREEVVEETFAFEAEEKVPVEES